MDETHAQPIQPAHHAQPGQAALHAQGHVPPANVAPPYASAVVYQEPKGIVALLERQTARTVFASRWLQAPLYLGLIVAQAVYVVIFIKELVHLVLSLAENSDEAKIMLTVLGLIDVVMISNLLIMVIIGGYETFVAKLKLGSHPDRPDWLSHTNENTMKIKLSLALIGISSISLLKSYIDVEHSNPAHMMWQAILHGMFLISCIAIAFTVWISNKANEVGHDVHR